MVAGLRGSFFRLRGICFVYFYFLHFRTQKEILKSKSEELSDYVWYSWKVRMLVFLYSQISAAPVMWCNLIESDHFDTLNWHESEYTWNNQPLSMRVSYDSYAKKRAHLFHRNMSKREFKCFQVNLKWLAIWIKLNRRSWRSSFNRRAHSILFWLDSKEFQKWSFRLTPTQNKESQYYSKIILKILIIEDLLSI